MSILWFQRQAPAGSLIENDYTLHIGACWVISAVLIGLLLMHAWRAYQQATQLANRDAVTLSLKRASPSKVGALQDEPTETVAIKEKG